MYKLLLQKKKQFLDSERSEEFSDFTIIICVFFVYNVHTQFQVKDLLRFLMSLMFF